MNHALRYVTRLLPLLLLCVALAACGGDKQQSGDGEHADHDEHDDHGHGHKAVHGGVLVESSDHSMHFEIAHDAGAGLVKLWLYDGDVKPITTSEIPVVNLPLDSGPVQVKGMVPSGAKESTEWHFSHEALKGHVHGARLRVMAMDRSYMVDFPDVHDEEGHDDHEGHAHDKDGDHDGHAHDEDAEDHKGHDHDADEHEGHDHKEHGSGGGPHHGLVHPFSSADGKTTGFVELKLHDDKGDLELWIAADKGMKTPFDLPLASEVTVTFTSMKSRAVTLAVRNKDKNEDEDGLANNRDGKTNYFIFPGNTGGDAKWLMGKTFEATVTVSFDTPQGKVATQAFTLKPHAH
jgi:hypothetical protein